LGLPIGCIKFLFPKEFVTILGLGLQRTPYLLSSKDVRNPDLVQAPDNCLNEFWDFYRGTNVGAGSPEAKRRVPKSKLNCYQSDVKH